MRKFASSCILSVEKLGYSTAVYDLGDLGFGKPFKVDDPSFQNQGYYHETFPGRYDRGKHKPALIRDCLRSHNEFIVYLDADTLMLNKIDEMAGNYDIGVTVRPQWEVEKLIRRFHPDHSFIYNSFVNAGVMCFNPTQAAYRFLEKWEQKIIEVKDDQGAVNDMLKAYAPLKKDQTIDIDGIRIRTFDTMQYNYYYFHSPANSKSYLRIKDDITIKWQDAKILHFRGTKMRDEHARILSSLGYKESTGLSL